MRKRVVINPSVHSFLILAYSKSEGVSLDVGFYYMANAPGRLIGMVLPGTLYQLYTLEGCLFASSVFLLSTVIISIFLHIHYQSRLPVCVRRTGRKP